MIITPIGAAGAEALAALHGRCFAKPWRADAFATLLQSSAAFALAAQAAGAPLGFILAQGAYGDWEVLTLCVVPEARRQGAGAALVAAATEEARARGGAQVSLEVGADNSAARALYTRLGFAEAGRRAGYYLTPHGAVDAVVMRRALPLA